VFWRGRPAHRAGVPPGTPGHPFLSTWLPALRAPRSPGSQAAGCLTRSWTFASPSRCHSAGWSAAAGRPPPRRGGCPPCTQAARPVQGVACEGRTGRSRGTHRVCPFLASGRAPVTCGALWRPLHVAEPCAPKPVLCSQGMA